MTKLDKIAYSLLGFSIGLAIVLRIVWPWESVFKNGRVIFTEVDPYFHMRLADTIVRNWQSSTADPYFGFVIGIKQTFAWIISLLSFGNTEWLDYVAALVPAVCGILLVIVIFFLAKKLFNLWTGVLSALIVATLQGDLLARTSLGFTDHHCLEILLVISIICCIVYALKKSIHFMWPAGILLGIYYLVWAGAPMFLIILNTYIIVQSIINHIKKNNEFPFYLIMAVISTVALFIFILVPAQRSLTQSSYILSLALSALLPLVLYSIAQKTQHIGTTLYLAVLGFVTLITGIALFTIAVFWHEGFNIIESGFQRLIVLDFNDILESQPTTFQILWGNLGVVSIFGLIGGVMLLMYEKWKDGSIALIEICSLGILVVALMQRRFMYYLAPLIAVLCAYVIVLLASKLIVKYKGEIKTFAISCVVVFCCGFILIPNVLAAGRQNSVTQFAPTTAWLSACDWLKNNTWIPFIKEVPNENLTITPYILIVSTADNITLQYKIIEDPYYKVYNSADIGKGYRVLSWWDYGYWIVRIAQRPVICNPGGGLIVNTRACLNNEDIKESNQWIQDNKIKYIVIDYTMIGLKWPYIRSTENQKVEDSFIGQLWGEKRVEHWQKVWQSKEMYNKDSQVKIFEYKEE